ncbi:MAG: glycosyltransferase [Streptomycetaceae bacterium]|nr:glycosyltransferase [Streptomycetaceae bacterium]
MTVGIVVITRDRRDQLLATLDQLTALPTRPPVVVCDNASSDGTAEAVRARHPGVRVLCMPRNEGAVARNHGAAALDTPYVAFSDDDTWWARGSLAAAADLLDAHPRIAAVTARILVHDLAHPQADPYEDPIVPELRDSPIPTPDGLHLPGPALGSILAGASVLRLDAFRAAGGFSPRLWLGGEEELLSADLASAGWWLVYADALTVHHRPSPARDPHLRRRHGIRNTLWFTWLRRPAGSALRRTMYLAATVPRDGTSLRAFAEAAAGMPWVLRERRALPPAVERRLRLLGAPQRASRARRYVG